MKSKKNIKLKSNKSYISKKKSTKSNYKLKIIKYKQIIQDTIIYIQKYKTLDILTASDMNIYVQSLEKTFIELSMAGRSALSKIRMAVDGENEEG